MSSIIYSLINLAYLTTGRRLYALKLALEAAVSLGVEAVIALIEEAIAHDTRTSALEESWIRSRKVSTARGKAFELDSGIDATLGTIYTILTDNVRLFAPDNPIVVASKEILAQLFSEGIMPVITLPFEEQLDKNLTIIDRLKGDLHTAATTANIAPYLDHFKTLNAAFGVELKAAAGKEIPFDKLEASRDKGNLYIRRIAALIMGTFNSDSEEDAANRQTLLAPFLEQDDRIRKGRKGRRVPLDVDPQTGEEQPNEPIAE